MKRCIAAALMLCITAALFVSCAHRPRELDTRKRQQLNLLYEASNAIVRADCTDVDKEKGVSYITVSQSVSGKKSGSFSLKGSELEVGSQYLVFFTGWGEKGVYSEKEYTALKITDNAVVWDKKEYSSIDVLAKINEFDSVVSIYINSYFYEQRDKFLENCDVIVVGKVRSKTSRVDTKLRASTNGASIQNTLSCIRADIEVIGSIRGDYRNGDSITMMYAPERLSSMLDASTLSTVSMAERETLSLEEQKYYVFFLKKGPDPKQNYLFPINPAQGWARLANDILVTSEKNTVFRNADTLTKLIDELKK